MVNSQVSRDRRRDQVESLEEKVKAMETEREKMKLENKQLRLLVLQMQASRYQLLAKLENYKDSNNNNNYIKQQQVRLG